jgi:hypothetical protein
MAHTTNTSTPLYQVNGCILNSDGTVFASSFTIASMGAFRIRKVSAAFDGTNWYVCWDKTGAPRFPTTYSILGSFISTSGTVGVSANPDTDGPPSTEVAPSVAFANGTYVIVWIKNGSLVGRTMNTSGTFLTPITTIDSPSTDSNPNVSASPSNGYLITWQQNATPYCYVYGKIVDSSLNQTSGFIVVDFSTFFVAATPAAAFSQTDGQWLVTYVEQQYTGGPSTVYGRFVAPPGLVSMCDPLTDGSVTQGTAPRVAWSSASDQMLAVFQTSASGTKTITAQFDALSGNPPPPPASVTVTPGDSQVALTWPGVTGATGYIVERATSSSGPYVEITSPSVPSYTDTAVTNGTTYYYEVLSYNGAGASTSFAGPASATPSAASSITALFVVGNTTLNSGDSAALTRLQNLGYTVVTKQDSAVQSSDATGKALVVISSTTTPANFGTIFTGVTVPVLVWQSGSFNALGLTGPTAGTNYGTTTGQTQVAMVSANSSNPMAAGLTGTVQVIPSADTFSWGVPSSAGISIATLASDSTKSVILGYDVGAIMASGSNAPARRVGFFLTDVTAASLNSNGGALFDAAARWAAGAPTQVVTIASVLHDSAGHPQLNWIAVSGATSYQILSSTSLNGPYTVIATGVTGNSFTDTSATVGQTDYYIVVAENAGGVGPQAGGAAGFLNEVYIFGRTGLRTWTPQQNAGNAWNTCQITAQNIPWTKTNPGWTADAGTAIWSVTGAGLNLTPGGDGSATLTVTQQAAPGINATISYSLQFHKNNSNPVVTERPTVVSPLIINQAVGLTVMLRFPYVVGNNQKRSQRLNVFNTTDKPTRDAARQALADTLQQQLSIYFNGNTWTPPTPPGWEQADIGFYVTADKTYDETGATAIAKQGQFPDAWIDGTFNFQAFASGKDTQPAVTAQDTNNLFLLKPKDTINVYLVPHVLTDNTLINAWTIDGGAGGLKRTIFVGDDATNLAATVMHEIGHCLWLRHPEDDPANDKIIFHHLNNPNWDAAQHPGTNQLWYNLMQGDPTNRRNTYLTDGQSLRAYFNALAHSAKSPNPPQ